MKGVAMRVRGRNVGLYVRMAFIPVRKYKIILYGMVLCWRFRQLRWRNGARVARRRCAGVGSRGLTSPGWRARVCGRGAGVMCAVA